MDYWTGGLLIYVLDNRCKNIYISVGKTGPCLASENGPKKCVELDVVAVAKI